MRSNTLFLVGAMVALIISGCSAFGRAPGSIGSDAGTMPVGDGGTVPMVDGGFVIPPLADAGPPLGDVPVAGSPCDPDRDLETYDCALEGCDRAYLACLGSATWRCVPDVGAICMAPVEPPDAGPVATDAGMTETDAGTTETDAGCEHATETDAGATPVDAGTDAGPVAVDAGRTETCDPGSVQIGLRSCGVIGYRPCNVATGSYDGEYLEIPGIPCPSTGTDAGPPAAMDAGTMTVDAGTDAGPAPVDAGTDAPAPVDAGTDAPVVMVDAGSDAGPAPVDAGSDAGSDAGTDAGPVATDAGTTWTRNGRVRMCLDISPLARTGVYCPTGGAPDIRLFLTDGSALSSDRASCLDAPASAIGLGPWNVTIWCQPDTGHMTWASGGYFSPRVIDMPLNTAVSTTDFTEITVDGRDVRANTFYCWDTTGTRTSSIFRRVQLQVVDSSSDLPTSCSGSTGR